MTRSFNSVLECAKEFDVDLRTAAMLLAVERVADATRVRGIYP